MTTTIAEWQRRFHAGSAVWITFYRESDGSEEISEVYDTKEAATEEIAYAVKMQHRRPIIRCFHIHTLALACERWGDA